MKRTKEEFEVAVRNSFSIAGMCKQLGLRPCGGNYKLMHSAIEMYHLDVRHFRGKGWNVGLQYKPKKPQSLETLLTAQSHYQTYKLKRRLFSEGLKEKRCECCGLEQWQGHEIPLELHHKNGDSSDNRIENLLILCPNCHALTSNYRGLNNKSATKETL